MSPNRREFFSSAAAAATAASVAGAGLLPTSAQAHLWHGGSKKVRSASAMTFAPDGKLVVADWRAGVLHALALPDIQVTKEASFNVLDLSGRLAKAFRTEPAALRVTAAALHQGGQTAALAVAIGRKADAPVGLALVEASGRVSVVKLDEAVIATQPLDNTPAEALLWSKQPTRSLLVTDIKAHGNELFVSGITNSSFDSTLRRLPYPFDGAGSTAQVAMYHAVHNQIETRAPVRAFNIIDVAGQPTLLAAYTCTPLVTVPLADIQDGAKLRGKTIAELGFGNTPLDVLPFSISHQGKTSDWVLVANSAKSADLISLPDIVAAAQGAGLSTPVKAPFEQFAGVRSIPLPIAGVQRVMDQGPQFFTVLRRSAEEGELQLVSVRKGAFFRLSDHVNEYDFPSYAYPGEDKFQQEYIRPFHQMMKTDEGHAGLVK